MTDETTDMTYSDLLSAIQKAFQTGRVATPAEAAQIRVAIDKLLAPGRGSTMDFSDPANSGMASVL